MIERPKSPKVEDDDGEISPSIPETEISQECCAMRKLWVAVIARAAMDANLSNTKSSEKRATEDAQKWFTTRSSDLELVCDLAGVSSEKAFTYGIKNFLKNKLQ